MLIWNYWQQKAGRVSWTSNKTWADEHNIEHSVFFAVLICQCILPSVVTDTFICSLTYYKLYWVLHCRDGLGHDLLTNKFHSIHFWKVVFAPCRISFWSCCDLFLSDKNSAGFLFFQIQICLSILLLGKPTNNDTPYKKSTYHNSFNLWGQKVFAQFLFYICFFSFLSRVRNVQRVVNI